MSFREKTAVLVVCMGNICRSPTGEAVLKAKALQQELEVLIDSAGTIGFHRGNPPDARARQAGERRGYSFSGIRARQVSDDDFERFDMILAADKENLIDLKQRCPTHLRYKLSLFLSHGSSDYSEIPDPYYGGDQGFELVLDLIEEAADAVLAKLPK